MGIMCLKTIFAPPRTTISDPAAYTYPYLLRGLNVTLVNLIWQIDISYVPMHRGFMYLVPLWMYRADILSAGRYRIGGRKRPGNRQWVYWTLLSEYQIWETLSAWTQRWKRTLWTV